MALIVRVRGLMDVRPQIKSVYCDFIVSVWLDADVRMVRACVSHHAMFAVLSLGRAWAACEQSKDALHATQRFVNVIAADMSSVSGHGEVRCFCVLLHGR